jgi:hypothetical protein
MERVKIKIEVKIYVPFATEVWDFLSNLSSSWSRVIFLKTNI